MLEAQKGDLSCFLLALMQPILQSAFSHVLRCFPMISRSPNRRFQFGITSAIMSKDSRLSCGLCLWYDLLQRVIRRDGLPSDGRKGFLMREAPMHSKED